MLNSFFIIRKVACSTLEECTKKHQSSIKINHFNTYPSGIFSTQPAPATKLTVRSSNTWPWYIPLRLISTLASSFGVSYPSPLLITRRRILRSPSLLISLPKRSDIFNNNSSIFALTFKIEKFNFKEHACSGWNFSF